MAIPLYPTSALPKSCLKEALDKVAPLVLNSSPWGCTPSCVPLPDLLAMVGQLLAMLMISSTYSGTTLHCSPCSQESPTTIPAP